MDAQTGELVWKQTIPGGWVWGSASFSNQFAVAVFLRLHGHAFFVESGCLASERVASTDVHRLFYVSSRVFHWLRPYGTSLVVPPFLFEPVRVRNVLRLQ